MKNRITLKDIAFHRARLVKEQDGLCPLCETPLYKEDRVHLDHDHKTGVLRSSLHGACNMSLGKLERAAAMTKDPQKFIQNIPEYLSFHRENPSHLIHPTFLTLEEKALKRKKRALRKNRAKPK